MIDPNVLNYFLVILGGFGVVWSYRRVRGEQNKKIGEFEYAAFSALWGIPVFLIFLEAIKSKPEMVNGMFVTPMIASPTLFIMGAFFGMIGAEIVSFFFFLRSHFANKRVRN